MQKQEHAELHARHEQLQHALRLHEQVTETSRCRRPCSSVVVTCVLGFAISCRLQDAVVARALPYALI